MSHDRTEGRRARKLSRAFRPTLEGVRLEPRVVMSHTPFALNQFLLTHPSAKTAQLFNDPIRLSKNAHRFFGPTYNQGNDNVQTARGGQAVIIAQPDGSHFRVSIQLADNVYDGGLSAQTGSSGTLVVPSAPVQPVGTVRAYAMPGGKVGLIVDGTTLNSQLEIDPLPFPQRKGYAHSFAYGVAGETKILQVGSINVTSGTIGAVIGYKDADLSGPLTIGGTTTVDRIAFNALLPGAAIGTGGTVNTLDVATDATLTSGPGITIAGDLNLFNVGGNLTLANGANIIVKRFAGLTPQPPKGTGTGSNILSLNQSQIGTGTSQLVPSVSANIQGDLTIGTGSTLAVVSGIANSSVNQASLTAAPTIFLINGSLNVVTAKQIAITNFLDSNQIGAINGFPVPTVDLVHRNGAFVSGTKFVSIAANIPG